MDKEEAMKILKDFHDKSALFSVRTALETLHPKLKESEDERVRKAILELVRQSSEVLDKQNQNNMIAWLKKQYKETSWKPSKEEMDVLYGLAYITNQYDEHKEEVITRLYQDLKREFFNSSSYENMFPNTQDGVRRRSTIQVLEYARSLDNYNQYGKADIDKNIAWLEKQCKEDSSIQQAYEWGYTEGKRIERKHWVEKQKFSEDYNSIDPQFGKPIEQNPAWSEEDEEMFEYTISLLNYNLGCRKWLKSLKERYTWKPSDKQMHAFEQVYDWYNNNFAPSETLTSLYKDLEKLKGE